MKLIKQALAIAGAALLSGCFLVPGRFNSSLDIRRDGAFTFAYQGEIAVAGPDEMSGDSKPKVWSDTMARCFKDGRKYSDESDSSPDADTNDDPSDDPRPCTRAETAELKKEFETQQSERVQRKKKEAAEMAAMMGLSGGDDETARKVAADLMKYDGWKSVVYRGKGVYEVDYRLSGRIGHDFIFPIFPQGDLMVPFVIVRGRNQGSVMISSPALTGGGLKGLAARGRMLGAAGSKDMPQTAVVTKGRFTITTDGEILTNNTQDGPAKVDGGRQLVWDIDGTTEKIPEALIRLK